MNFFPFFCNCVWVLHGPNRLSSATSQGFGGLQADRTWPFYQLFLWFYDSHRVSLYNSSNNLLYKSNYIKRGKISTKRCFICKISYWERNSFLETIFLEESTGWMIKIHSQITIAALGNQMCIARRSSNNFRFRISDFGNRVKYLYFFTKIKSLHFRNQKVSIRKKLQQWLPKFFGRESYFVFEKATKITRISFWKFESNFTNWQTRLPKQYLSF